MKVISVYRTQLVKTHNHKETVSILIIIWKKHFIKHVKKMKEAWPAGRVIQCRQFCPVTTWKVPIHGLVAVISPMSTGPKVEYTDLTCKYLAYILMLILMLMGVTPVPQGIVYWPLEHHHIFSRLPVQEQWKHFTLYKTLDGHSTCSTKPVATNKAWHGTPHMEMLTHL